MELAPLAIVVTLALFGIGGMIVRKVTWGETEETIDRPGRFAQLFFRSLLFIGCAFGALAVTPLLLKAAVHIAGREPTVLQARLLFLALHLPISAVLYRWMASSGRRSEHHRHDR